MKRNLFALVLSALLVNGLSLSAFAFSPSIFYGAAFFTATKACPDLGIAQNDQLSVTASYTSFSLSKVTQSGFQPPFLRFTMPDDATYYFVGDIGLQSSNELATNGFDGTPFYDIKLLDSGDLQILYSNLPAGGKCTLTQPPFGG